MFLLFPFCFSSEKGVISKYYNEKIVNIEASGSTKQDINGSRQLTKPEYAIYPWDKRYDWCSNVGRSYSVHPWIAISLEKRKIKFNGYFIRCGCCYDFVSFHDDDEDVSIIGHISKNAHAHK